MRRNLTRRRTRVRARGEQGGADIRNLEAEYREARRNLRKNIQKEKDKL